MGFKNTILHFGFAFLVSACGMHNGAPPLSGGDGIVNGKSLPPRNPVAKSVVALVSDRSEGQALCTGTILDEQNILTAAHCVDRNSEHIYIVFRNRLTKAMKDDVRSADDFLQLPEWKKSKGESGDIAVIHFTGGLPEGYQAVQLADSSVQLQVGEEVVMAGYGVSHPEKDAGSGALRETKTTITGSMNRNQIATDGRLSSVCFGDSGGPAFVHDGAQWIQWGVAHAVSNRDCDETSLHTSIVPYQRWIRSAMKILSK